MLKRVSPVKIKLFIGVTSGRVWSSYDIVHERNGGGMGGGGVMSNSPTAIDEGFEVLTPF